MEENTKSKFELSLENGPHAQLARLAGNWQGTAKTWFEPDKLADESPASGSVTPVLGGRFALYQYKGEMMGKPLEGIAIIGYNLDKGGYQVAWVDSFHMGTGILLSEPTPGASDLSVLGSYSIPEMPEPWGWRTEIKLVNDTELVMTAYNIIPGEGESKATEVVYHKVK